ncbi:hypothetical protein [Halomarina rubra]|uniref:Uncharacterized protein n=1 Tax=Halomarina rubra TaxID=2071873 RepID=A0ABD6AXK5_9EURY|nr:hypothetical protein [Halomarina rubra]
MSESTTLIDLQKRQREHDRGHHRDIYTLPYFNRMNHYVLHFSKYVGRLSQDYPDGGQLTTQLEQTLADSFIVAIAAANTLNLDLQAQLEEMFGLEAEGIEEWTNLLNQSLDDMGSSELKDWWFKRMAGPTGRMANALESLDHMESINSRQILEEDTTEIVANLLIVAESMDLDLVAVLDARWEEIESNSIL